MALPILPGMCQSCTLPLNKIYKARPEPNGTIDNVVRIWAPEADGFKSEKRLFHLLICDLGQVI